MTHWPIHTTPNDYLKEKQNQVLKCHKISFSLGSFTFLTYWTCILKTLTKMTYIYPIFNYFRYIYIYIYTLIFRYFIEFIYLFESTLHLTMKWKLIKSRILFTVIELISWLHSWFIKVSLVHYNNLFSEFHAKKMTRIHGNIKL